MKIRMRTISAGPTGTHKPGDVVDVPEAEARELLAGHYAEPVRDLDAERAVKPAGEQATTQRGGGRGNARPSNGGGKGTAGGDGKES